MDFQNYDFHATFGRVILILFYFTYKRKNDTLFGKKSVQDIQRAEFAKTKQVKVVSQITKPDS